MTTAKTAESADEDISSAAATPGSRRPSSSSPRPAWPTNSPPFPGLQSPGARAGAGARRSLIFG
ncbi:hypothetical protein [Segniliparus rugosus]|uniref:hypothetical protein n=1 Tax=Segniliparus rugosus TaxID=286804 RepID=UPI0012EBCC8C|nr:hypothetical protein [Segniliparus rugosus]